MAESSSSDDETFHDGFYIKFYIFYKNLVVERIETPEPENDFNNACPLIAEILSTSYGKPSILVCFGNVYVRLMKTNSTATCFVFSCSDSDCKAQMYVKVRINTFFVNNEIKGRRKLRS